MGWLIVLAICILIIVWTLIGIHKRNSRIRRAPVRGRQILTMQEQPTFLNLQAALPEHIVLAQVAFSAFLTAKGYANRSVFNRKVADFVVLDRKFKLVAVVELDESSHKTKYEQDLFRDELIKEAGYTIIRYKKTPTPAQIKADFARSCSKSSALLLDLPISKQEAVTL